MRLIPSNTTLSATLIAGTGNSGSALNELNKPEGVVVDQTETYFYVADTGNHRILRWKINQNTTNGEVIAGITGTGQSYNNTLKKPQAVSLNRENSALYIVDTDNSRIQKLIFALNRTTTVAGNFDGTEGSTSNQLKKALAIAIDYLENVYIADTENNRIQFFCANSNNGPTILSTINWDTPSGIVIDSFFNLYISNTNQNSIFKFNRII